MALPLSYPLTKTETMDTSVLENVAEDLITHELQHYGLLVAKPKNDQNGTDLIVFSEIADGVKFCRAQAKGRSFRGSKNTNVKIKKEYVSNGFVCFLYLEFNIDDRALYFFYSNDIEVWNLSKEGEYELNLSVTTSKEKLKPYVFDESKIQQIQAIIREAEVKNEFKRVAFISGNAFHDATGQCTLG